MNNKANEKQDPEIKAISEVHSALSALEGDAQGRVLRYVAEKLKIVDPVQPLVSQGRDSEQVEARAEPSNSVQVKRSEEEDGELGGVSPAGKKWITRSGLSVGQLSSIFSIGGDEIDLISKSVPGNGKAARMRSVILLKGLASYLGTGAARLTDQEIRQTCLDYDAMDAKNYAATIKSLSAEVTGSKETGYTLSPRGQASATEMVKSIAVSGKGE